MDGISYSRFTRMRSHCSRALAIGSILALLSCGGESDRALNAHDTFDDTFDDMPCVPDCAGKDCGDNGCGGSCGECDQGVATCSEGECLYACWNDASTGFTWEASFIAKTYEWKEAGERCDALSLCGHDDWRLPDIGELRTLIRGCPATGAGSGTCEVEGGGCLASTCVDGDLCEPCSNLEGPADGCYWPHEMQGPCKGYWSSSLVEDEVSSAWFVGFDSGYVGSNLTIPYSDAPVRCVR